MNSAGSGALFQCTRIHADHSRRISSPYGCKARIMQMQEFSKASSLQKLLYTMTVQLTFEKFSLPVEAAARFANAHEFIQTIPDGYQALVGDTGVRLTGPQRLQVSFSLSLSLSFSLSLSRLLSLSCSLSLALSFSLPLSRSLSLSTCG